MKSKELGGLEIKLWRNINERGIEPIAKIAASPNAAERFAEYAVNTVLGRVGRMDEVAAAVSYLVSEEAGFITGEIVDFNGGAFMP